MALISTTVVNMQTLGPAIPVLLQAHATTKQSSRAEKLYSREQVYFPELGNKPIMSNNVDHHITT